MSDWQPTSQSSKSPSGSPTKQTPSAHVEARPAALERPAAPADAAFERDGARLQPHALVLPHRHAAVAQVETLGALTRGEQL